MTTIKLFLWSWSKFSSRSKIIPVNNKIKGQLISEWNFGVFKSPKKPTKFLTDFCPSFIKFILRLTVDIESSRSWGKKINIRSFRIGWFIWWASNKTNISIFTCKSDSLSDISYMSHLIRGVQSFGDWIQRIPSLS